LLDLQIDLIEPILKLVKVVTYLVTLVAGLIMHKIRLRGMAVTRQVVHGHKLEPVSSRCPCVRAEIRLCEVSPATFSRVRLEFASIGGQAVRWRHDPFFLHPFIFSCAIARRAKDQKGDNAALHLSNAFLMSSTLSKIARTSACIFAAATSSFC